MVESKHTSRFSGTGMVGVGILAIGTHFVPSVGKMLWKAISPQMNVGNSFGIIDKKTQL